MYSFYSIKGWYEFILLSGRVIQTHFTQWKGDTNSFYSIERWYKLILLHERVTHIHFTQWKGDTNFFDSREGWYKCISLNGRVTQTHFTQWNGDINSFSPVEGWYKLILLQWMKKQTQLTCNEKETQTEGRYKLIFLSGRVTLTHITPRKWHNLILLHGRKKQTHLTWKGDNDRVTQTEGWHTLNLLHWRVTQTHFSLILCSKWAELPEILMKPNSLWKICISSQWQYVLFKYQWSFQKICWAVEQRSNQDKKNRLTDGLVKTLHPVYLHPIQLVQSLIKSIKKILNEKESHWILYYIP